MRAPPLFLFIALLTVSICAFSKEVFRSKDWTVVYESSYQEAYTSNKSRSSIGVFCVVSSSNCFYYLETKLRCKKKEEIPALISADIGAYSDTLICTPIRTKRGVKYVYVFSNYNVIMKALIKGIRIGVVIPTETGQFKVSRFSLRGSRNAIQAARTIKNRVRRPKPSSKDIYL